MNNFVKTLTLLFLSFIGAINAQEKVFEKKLYIPTKAWYVPENNNYSDAESDYSYSRMIESDNIAMFWHKDYGKDPMKNKDITRRFDPKKAIVECERFYNFYVNDLKLVQKGQSISDKYKLLIFIINGEGNTAFGGGAEEKIGILWTPATRMNKPPYGALAHEIGHSFQYMSRADSGTGPKGPIMEMSAQYMLWQVYPNWMTFENYHLVDYLKGTHYGFLHSYNTYHSPYVIEYWSQKHGKEFFGKLMRNTEKGEDAVMTYKRLNNLSQEQFNDEMFDASRKFITWDLKRVDSVARQYANTHFTKVNKLKKGWYEIDSINCPQNYGYNGIKLNVPETKTKIKLEFKGIAGADGFEKVKVEKAGWRYGFVAQLKNGSRIYSKMFKKTNAKVSFKVPNNTKHIWLVVSGAPTEHWPRPIRRGKTPDKTADEQWPYQFKLMGTDVSR